MNNREKRGIIGLVAICTMLSSCGKSQVGDNKGNNTSTDNTSIITAHNSVESGIESSENSAVDSESKSVDEIYNDKVSVDYSINASDEEMLEVGQWGICNKYNGNDEKYENVNIRVNSINSGEVAESSIKTLMVRVDKYAYVQSPKNMTYVYIEYEINFGDEFYVDEYDGAVPNVSVRAFNKDKKAIEVDKLKYSIVGTDITTSENVAKQGKGRVAILMPDGYEEAYIQFGDNNDEKCTGIMIKENAEE